MASKIENVKNLFRKPGQSSDGEVEYNPFLLFEARIDFKDVRTGFRGTYHVNRAFSIPPDRLEPVWDDCYIQDADPEKLDTAAPPNARLRELPEFVDVRFISRAEAGFIQHLLRTFNAKVYRNYFLDTYSSSGESMSDFIIRCIDLIQNPMYGEFDAMHEVFKRKLARLKQKYLERDDAEGFEEIKRVSRSRELFNYIDERISALFLRTEFSIQRVSRPTGAASFRHELEERLQALHFEAQETVTRILDTYEERVRSVDEYILHPTIRDIHFVQSYLLWLPTGAL